MLAYKGTMDAQRYVGIGVYHPKTATLALHFKEVGTSKVGAAHFHRSGKTLDGTWVWMDDENGKPGKEVRVAE